MPEYTATAGDQTARRWHLFQWLEDYTSRAFATTRKVKEEIAPQLHLHNVAIDRLFVSTFMFNGMHRWAAYGDELYMACYPWSYLNWRGGNEMPHSQTHWISGWVRGLARHYGIPWGVFMELWEHDASNRRLPPFWSVSQFYSLLAEGAHRLDTFLVSFGTEVFGISFERLREFGRELNKVRPFFLLLPQTARPRARMAFVNPWAEWVQNPPPHRLPPGHEGYGYYRRYAYPFDTLYPHENRRMLAYELFHRVFNDLDQVDEQLLCEAPMDYQAIVLSDCTFLMKATMAKLRSFTETGGVLILDHVPQRDENGQFTDAILSMMTGEPERSEVVVPGLNCNVFRFGKGFVVLFSTSLQTAYADAVEGGRPGIRTHLECGIADILAHHLGLRSRFLSSNGDIDVGLRLGDGVALVPLANTSPQRQVARITLRELPFTPQLAVNLTTGAFISCEANGQTAEFHVELDAHHGALCALYPSTPHTCQLSLSQRRYRRGEELSYHVRLLSQEREPVRGMFVVHVSVTDDTGRKHHRLGGPLLVNDGLAQFKKALPINASCGTYAVRVEEPILGLSAVSEFTIEPLASVQRHFPNEDGPGPHRRTPQRIGAIIFFKK